MRFLHWVNTNYAAYVLALVGVAVATGVRYQLGPVLGGTIPS